MAILSIQSRVVSGYVGNAAAVPILQRLGHTVWPIDSVVFSNHPAQGSFRGRATPSTDIAELLEGLEDRGLFTHCDALLSGYLGSAETGQLVKDNAERVRSGNGSARWFCDPVMGDNGEFYVSSGIPEFFRDHALSSADVILPNSFEASFLSGIEIESIDTAVKAATVLIDKGPDIVVITGIRAGAAIGAIAATAQGIWRCNAPTVDVPASGAGDIFSALFVGQFLISSEITTALRHAVSGAYAILQATAEAGAADLNLISALPKLHQISHFPLETIR